MELLKDLKYKELITLKNHFNDEIQILCRNIDSFGLNDKDRDIVNYYKGNIKIINRVIADKFDKDGL